MRLRESSRALSLLAVSRSLLQLTERICEQECYLSCHQPPAAGWAERCLWLDGSERQVCEGLQVCQHSARPLRDSNRIGPGHLLMGSVEDYPSGLLGDSDKSWQIAGGYVLDGVLSAPSRRSKAAGVRIFWYNSCHGKNDIFKQQSPDWEALVFSVVVLFQRRQFTTPAAIVRGLLNNGKEQRTIEKRGA